MDKAIIPVASEWRINS